MERSREMVLKRLIEKTGLSMKAFAEKIDIPYTTLYSMLERGVGKASVDNVLKICKALGITAEEMLSMAAEDEDDSSTLAAHHDGDVWTEEELESIKKFKEFVKSQRKS